jgi:hypothetical protein
MSVQRSVHLLTVAAALGTLVGCSSSGPEHNRPDQNAVAVQWDSGPIDQDYHRQRTDMDARHTQEMSSPRADESSDQRTQRQTSESKDLDKRYADGKASHAKAVPPAER